MAIVAGICSYVMTLTLREELHILIDVSKFLLSIKLNNISGHRESGLLIAGVNLNIGCLA